MFTLILDVDSLIRDRLCRYNIREHVYEMREVMVK